jgi:putative endonuclease
VGDRLTACLAETRIDLRRLVEAGRTAVSGFLGEYLVYKVYVLKSKVANKSYVGMSNDLERRLEEHNSGKNSYTSKYLPWEIVYSEDFAAQDEALKREKYLKSTSGRRFLKKVFFGLSNG